MTASRSENTPSCIEVTDFFALPDYTIVDLDGPDAVVFAQAQFANDVTALGIGQWQWNCWLNAKGRVLALFALLRTGETSLRLLLPDVDAQELATALARYVFRRKLQVRARPDLHVAGRLAAPGLARGPLLHGSGDATLELDFGSDAQPRCLRIQDSPAATDADAAQAWAVADLQLGLPRLPASQREAWTPQQLGLERFPAFSVKKGCYPGQEIVARTHFLGKAKREALLLQVADTAQAGAEVLQGGQAVGSLASAAGHQPRWALAVVSLERDPGPLLVDGQPALPQPFHSRAGQA